jgi:putative zinc finger/helix-turn-helix YgiT family protein
MDFTTDVKHDGVVHRIHLPGLEVPRCQTCGETIITNAVDEQINDALRRHLRLLTPSQMRQGVKALGLSQQELAERLGVAKETISRWVNGALIQSRAMDNLLRIYFALPEVRAALLGRDQDPQLGVISSDWQGEDPPQTPARTVPDFPLARRAYGEDGLRRETVRVRERGFFYLGRG